jgi:hypothetical protein
MKVRGAGSVFALAVALSFLLTPAMVAAQYYSANQAVDFIWVKTFGFQKSWLNNPNDLITQAILPTVAIYAVFLGLIRTLRIFQGMGSMEHLISVVVCLTMLFSGALGWVSGIMAFLGIWSIAIFLILMFVGGILYSIGFYKRNKYAQVDSVMSVYDKAVNGQIKDIKRYDKQINKWGKELTKLSKNSVKLTDQRMIHANHEIELYNANKKAAELALAKIREDFATLPPEVLEEKKK